ncbi:MAG TPA: hypothetical protein VFB94_27350, partial [Acidimicrobiales bacterium]|nr:hypothetical protein [Acidimicrobiales bacterium]
GGQDPLANHRPQRCHDPVADHVIHQRVHHSACYRTNHITDDRCHHITNDGNDHAPRQRADNITR